MKLIRKYEISCTAAHHAHSPRLKANVHNLMQAACRDHDRAHAAYQRPLASGINRLLDKRADVHFEFMGLQVLGLSVTVTRSSVDDYKCGIIDSICFYISLLQYQYTFNDHQRLFHHLVTIQTALLPAFVPPQGAMPTNADRDKFEEEFVAKYNANNPNDPILGTGTKEDIEKWKARLWLDGSAKKQRPEMTSLNNIKAGITTLRVGTFFSSANS
jgi:hypothetical protein